jgi:hypothetical protein
MAWIIKNCYAVKRTNSKPIDNQYVEQIRLSSESLDRWQKHSVFQSFSQLIDEIIDNEIKICQDQDRQDKETGEIEGGWVAAHQIP